MRDHNFFEGFARKNKMFPQGYVSTREGRILLADSEELIHEDGKIFYRTGYAIERGGLDIGNYNDYEIGEDFDQKARLNEAVIHARTLMTQLNDAGYFDDDRKNHFSQ